MEVINCYSGLSLPLIFEIRQNSSKSQKIVKKHQKTHQKKSQILTPNPQYQCGHHFFQYFSLAEPSKWLLVNENMTLKIFENFQKIDHIFRKIFLNPCHGSKMASRTLLNGSGVFFLLNFSLPNIIWTLKKPYIKFVNS